MKRTWRIFFSRFYCRSADAERTTVAGFFPLQQTPLPIESLVKRLAERGLEIPSQERAARYLRHIGYYRLSPYTIPFQLGGPDHQFDAGTSFDGVLDLYVFDRELRLLVLDAVERVEVAVRAALTDHMATKYDDAHWYADSSHFYRKRCHANLLAIVRDTGEKQLMGKPDKGEDSLVHASALEHYLTTYETPELPPSWLMMETLTIGQLTNLYRNIRLRSDKNAVARTVGLTAPVLESWMTTCTRVRNVSAHHGRLWTLGLGVYPAIPTSSGISWLKGNGSLPPRSRKRLYPVLVSLQSVLDTISPHSSWAQRLYALLNQRPNMNLRGMGVPLDWATDAFWEHHIY